uniref:peptide MFS transporter n=2 Tax=Prevotella sp. TaxID=59823 RepID=UPI004025BBE0
MFENQPKGLYALALANTGERFGYYTMLAIFVLFLQSNFGWGEGLAGTVYATFLMLVYFLPIVGGAVADKIGFGRCVTFGIIVMFIGYLLLAIPAGAGAAAIAIMSLALVLISMGTSLFKGNLQVMVGKLYDAPEYANQRDAGFSIFYMAINIGALFAPTAATKLHAWAMTALNASEASAYHYAFGVACLSLVVSIAIYYGFRWTFAQVDNTANKAKKANDEKAVEAHVETPEEKADTHSRLVALFLVFAVVIFFWMAFHQNGLTLTYFARDFTQTTATGLVGMLFDVTNLLGVIVMVYALFAIFQSKTTKGQIISGVVILACAAFLGYKFFDSADQTVNVDVPLYQQFNPCFVVMLTPVSMALFGWLASKKKEPSAPRKIGLGMLVAGIGYVIMIAASIGLSYHASYVADDPQRVSPLWLVSTYLVLTFAELLLSPMGISFVSKVAPQKYQGVMMGCWFGATAIGNFLVQIPAYLWNNVPLTAVWGVLVALCLASFVFIFSVMKKLEKVA